jgi:hypothetical protein
VINHMTIIVRGGDRAIGQPPWRALVQRFLLEAFALHGVELEAGEANGREDTFNLPMTAVRQLCGASVLAQEHYEASLVTEDEYGTHVHVSPAQVHRVVTGLIEVLR